MSVAQLGFELGMAVSEYNSGRIGSYDTIIRYTLMYIEEVKKGVASLNIKEDELPEYYLVVGQAWASIHNEKLND
jgi:hypothetical protein